MKYLLQYRFAKTLMGNIRQKEMDNSRLNLGKYLNSLQLDGAELYTNSNEFGSPKDNALRTF